MKELILHYFHQYEEAALFISVLVNILISIAGVIPSAFLTGANLLFFGFEKGVLISIAGEIGGAAFSFFLYRRGAEWLQKKTNSVPRVVQKLQTVKGWGAFKLLLSMRLLPFVPSGVVTAIAAASSVSFILFMTASIIGKIPAVILEALAVQEVMKNNMMGKVILILFAVGLLMTFYKKRTA